jgi:molybdopterin converting factor small subunit
MKVSFFLKSPGAERSSIFCRVNWNSKTAKFGTNLTTVCNHWDKLTQKFKQTLANPSNPEQNRYLKKLVSDVETQYLNFRNNNDREPTETELKDLIAPIIPSQRRAKELGEANKRKEEEAKRQTLIEYYRDFVARSKAGTRIKKGHAEGATTNGTAKMHQTTFNKILEFNSKLDFQNIDMVFYNDFVAWLHSQNYSTNYIGRQIKNLKAVLNEAEGRGIATNTAIKSKYFANLAEEVETIYLSETELAEIKGIDLTHDKTLDKVRDLFLIGCYTGQRFSDWAKVTPQNIRNGFIEFVQQKNSTVKKTTVNLPLHSVVREIFEKYEGKLPPPISNQKTNDYLKEVAKLAPSLHTIETTTSTKGGRQVTLSKSKFELVSTHTARRSFATNSYLIGIPSLTIMAITGHKTEKDFLKYIKVTPDQHAKIFQAHWDKTEPEPILRAI